MLICASFLVREGQTQFVDVAVVKGGSFLLRRCFKESRGVCMVFATGPEDPLHIQHKFFCIICRVILPMLAQGIYETKRHYQSQKRLCREQRYRQNYCPDALRGTDARLIHGIRLAAEGEVYMDWEIPEMDHKWPFYYEVVEGKPFQFTSVDGRGRFEIQPLNTFLKSGDQFWVQEDFWNQVGILTGKAASTSDFNWS